MANNDLNLYKIPQVDTNLAQSSSNPADIEITNDGNVSGSATTGITEQQVRDIVGQNNSTGLKEDQVRAIINSALQPTLGTIISEDQVRNIVSIAMRGANVMTEDKVRAIVNSMQKFLTGQNIMVDGIQKSQNFYTGVSGWQIDAEGNAEFNDGTFRGRFEIGGTIITINTGDDIQTNLDIIEAAGGGTLYLQNGTYLLTADILIPSTTTLEGVSRDGVIIDCNTSYKVSMTGSNVYSTGTVTINNGDTTLEGVGTTWTTAMIGRSVLLDGLWYEITGRTDNDTLTISTYQGVNLAGSTYVLANINDNSSLNKVTITNATGVGLSVQYAVEPNLIDLIIYGCGTGIDMDYVTFPKMQVTDVENGVNLNMNYVEGFSIDFSEFNYATTGNGITMTNTRNSTFFDSAANDNTGDGINMTTCSKLAFISFDISGNGGQGIEFVATNSDNQLTDGTLDGNTSDGLKLTATTDRTQIIGMSIINNGGYGINIAASTCDDNQIISPAFSGNSSGTISDSGTNTTVLPLSDAQIFTSDGTWTKPAGAKTVTVVCIGAGGAGATGGTWSSGNNRIGGTGGGGGSIVEKTFRASDLSSTVAVTVATAPATDTAGGSSSFGTYITAYGGGKGYIEASQGSTSGGGGGGSAGTGADGNNVSVLGGLPASVAGADGISGQGAGGSDGTNGKVAEYGGASGGGISGSNTAGLIGGSSLFGAGGGGAGGAIDGANPGTEYAGGAGGAYNSYVVGGGGTAGAVDGGAGGAGTSRSGFGCGDGGGGGGTQGSGTGGVGGAGGAPGGGGGGGGSGKPTPGAGGAGGRGEVRVFSN